MVGVNSLGQSSYHNHSRGEVSFFSALSEQWWESPFYTQIVEEIRQAAAEGSLRPIVVLTSGPVSMRSIESFESELAKAWVISKTHLPEGLLSWHALNHELTSSELSRIAEGFHGVGARFVPSGEEHEGEDSTTKMYDARAIAQSHAESLDGDPIICWLDSDLEFSALVQDGDGLAIKQPWPWIHMVWYQSMHGDAVDLAIGDVTGDPPVPSSSTILTNLRDLVEMGEEMNGTRWSIRDPAYDLSELERPQVRFPPIGEVWCEDTDVTSSLLWKGTLNRPLVACDSILSQPHRPWFVRGGVTVVFNRAVMRTPTPRFNFNGKDVRRGDSFWLLRNLKKHEFSAGHFPFPLLHRRTRYENSADELSRSFQSRFLADLYGAAGLKGSVLSFSQSEVDLQHHLESSLRARAARSAIILRQSLATLTDANWHLTQDESELIHQTLNDTLTALESADLERAASELCGQISVYLGGEG